MKGLMADYLISAEAVEKANLLNRFFLIIVFTNPPKSTYN
jgi:hypothetical protein